MFDSSLVLGTFNSEYYWRDENLAKLPSINDKEANEIVMAMDELLFPFCTKDDILVTKYRFNECLKNYLNGIGFSFQTSDMEANDDLYRNDGSRFKSVCKLLCDTTHKEYYSHLIGGRKKLLTYAVLPHTEALCDIYGLKNEFPCIETIKRVNSKIYSNLMLDKIGIKNVGVIVEGCSALEVEGSKLLQKSPILVKDEFGVSGKGNMLVSSEKILKRILSYLMPQENEGKQVKFLLEPYLNKKLDFSCQMNIGKECSLEVFSTQRLYNNNFAYNGSGTADREFMDFLESQNYYVQMENVAKQLLNDGYFGPVCIDSMLLSDDEIVPVVEINARMSMGFISGSFNRFLSNYGKKGRLMFFSLGYKGNISFDEILSKMDESGLLFSLESCSGLIPLSAKTLFINRDLDEYIIQDKTYKGRLYVEVLYDTEEELNKTMDDIRNLLKSLGFQIYN